MGEGDSRTGRRRWLHAVVAVMLLLSALPLNIARGQGEEKVRFYLTLDVDRLVTDAARPGDVKRDFNDYACIPGTDRFLPKANARPAWWSADGTLEGECKWVRDLQGGGKENQSATLTGRVDLRSGQVSFTGKSSLIWDFPQGHSAASPIAPAHYEKHFQFEGTGSYNPASGAPNQPPSTKGTLKFSYSYSCSLCPAPYNKTVSGSLPFVMEFDPLPVALPSGSTCKPPPAITAGQIDRYLDFLAGQLQFAAENAPSGGGFSLRPLPLRRVVPGLTAKGGADLGRAVWDQAHALQRAHVRGELTLNEAQKQRTKAFGHWADYLEQRADPHLLSPDPPRYPLFGVINEKVPTPPQLKGEDILVLNVPNWGPEAITSDYFSAAIWTLAQGADLWYTRGLLWTAYLAYSEESLAPVILVGAMNIPYVGPALIGGLITFTEGNGLYRYFSEGENPLTWDEHVANYASLVNLGLAVHLRTNPNAARASLTGGIDEGRVGSDIASRLGGKSFKVLNERKDSTGNKYRTVEYAVIGPLQDNPQNKVAYFTKEFLVKDGPDGPRYFTFGSKGEPQTPVFFLGEKGYHAWSHLTEIKSGHRTPFDSMLSLFNGKKDYLDELKAIEQVMRDPTKSVESANQRYIGLVNKLIDDQSLTRVNGFYRWKNQDGTLAQAESNQFVLLPTTCGADSAMRTVPVRVSIDPTNGRLMNVFAMKPHNPAEAFVPETKVSVVRSLFASREIDSRLISYPPLYNYLPPDLRGGKEAR